MMNLLSQIEWGEFGFVGAVVGTVLGGVGFFLWNLMSILKEFLMGKNGDGGFLKAHQEGLASSRHIQESIDRTAQGIAASIEDHKQQASLREALYVKEFQHIACTHAYCISVHGGLVEAGKHLCDVMEQVCEKLEVREEVSPAFGKIRDALGRGSNPPRTDFEKSQV